MSSVGDGLRMAADQHTLDHQAGRLTSFGEHVLQVLLASAHAVEQEHLAILRATELACQQSQQSQPGLHLQCNSVESSSCTARSHVDDLDVESDDSNKGLTVKLPETDQSRRSSFGKTTFKVLGDWLTQDDPPDEDTTRYAKMQYKESLTKMLGRDNDSLLALAHPSQRTCLSMIPIKPTSVRRIVWDMLAAIVLGYEAFFTPMTVFDVPESVFTHVMAVSIMFYWSMDMLVSLISGYTSANGDLEVRFQRMALRATPGGREALWRLLPEFSRLAATWQASPIRESAQIHPSVESWPCDATST
eukprot:1145866-Amphidinium_carterae.1